MGIAGRVDNRARSRFVLIDVRDGKCSIAAGHVLSTLRSHIYLMHMFESSPVLVIMQIDGLVFTILSTPSPSVVELI